MRKTTLVTLALVIALTLAVGSAIPASASYPTYGNHYYQIVYSPGITWTAANAAASAATLEVNGLTYHGHLAVITSSGENNFIYNSLVQSALNGRAWIGGSQLSGQASVSAGWQWVTGETMSYRNWDVVRPGGDSPIPSPNDRGGTLGPEWGYEDNAENYMEMRGGGYWDDVSNSAGWLNNYVVEFEPLAVNIDIKPGSYPNSVNMGSNGVVPVAIFGSAAFDASTVDPSTVSLEGAQARLKGKSGSYGSLQDVNGDGYLDLVVQVTTEDLGLTEGASSASLTAATFSGIAVFGSDSISIVP